MSCTSTVAHWARVLLYNTLEFLYCCPVVFLEHTHKNQTDGKGFFSPDTTVYITPPLGAGFPMLDTSTGGIRDKTGGGWNHLAESCPKTCVSFGIGTHLVVEQSNLEDRLWGV